MFENYTQEYLVNDLIGKVVAIDRSIDTREGSMIYNAVAPIAAALAEAFAQLDVAIDQTYADTAGRDNLIKKCAERGLYLRPATAAIMRGEFNKDVTIGVRFSLGALNYYASERIGEGVYEMTCETPGSVSNTNIGMLIPIDYIEGLTFARITALLTPGQDEEATESLRKRYVENVQAQAFGGNVADYKDKVNGLDGVGGCKVIPIWLGAGTVKVVIINSDYNVPSTSLIADVQQVIDPIGQQGQGVGLAPIGHTVTIQGVTSQIINIQTTLTYAIGWDWNAVRQYVYDAIDAYLLGLSKVWADSSTLTVRISQVESELLGIEGIVDIADTKLNGAESNVTLDAYKIPKRGAVNVT